MKTHINITFEKNKKKKLMLRYLVLSLLVWDDCNWSLVMVTFDPYVDEVELELLVVDSLCVKDEELLLLFGSVVELELGDTFWSLFVRFFPDLKRKQSNL